LTLIDMSFNKRDRTLIALIVMIYADLIYNARGARDAKGAKISFDSVFGIFSVY